MGDILNAEPGYSYYWLPMNADPGRVQHLKTLGYEIAPPEVVRVEMPGLLYMIPTKFRDLIREERRQKMEEQNRQDRNSQTLIKKLMNVFKTNPNAAEKILSGAGSD